MTLVEFLQVSGVEHKRGAGAGEIRICCPFCVTKGETVDTRFRLGVNTNSNVAHCYNCGWKSRKASEYILKAIAGAPVSVESSNEEAVDETVVLPDGFEYLRAGKVDDWYHRKALKYLKEREVPYWQMEAKKTGITITGKFAYRIIFPVVYANELVGLVGRSFMGRDPKYLNSQGEKHIYNIPSKKLLKVSGTLVLSEGIFKALKIERVAGLASSSLLGHHLSDTQLDELLEIRHHVDKVIVWPDPDAPGMRGVMDVSSKLIENKFKVYTVWPIPKLQADEMKDISVKKYLKERLVRYSWGLEQKLKLAGTD